MSSIALSTDGMVVPALAFPRVGFRSATVTWLLLGVSPIHHRQALATGRRRSECLDRSYRAQNARWERGSDLPRGPRPSGHSGSRESPGSLQPAESTRRLA